MQVIINCFCVMAILFTLFKSTPSNVCRITPVQQILI